VQADVASRSNKKPAFAKLAVLGKVSTSQQGRGGGLEGKWEKRGFVLWKQACPQNSFTCTQAHMNT